MKKDKKVHESHYVPLAEQLRPTQWQDVIGQKHLLAPGKPLHGIFSAGNPHSMIFWGPPGVGKTTLARLSAKAFDCEWIALSAVLSGVKDIREAVEQAESNLALNLRTVLFVDELHRFNKAQQDALLPFTESGLITFIGATTENPSFSVNNALLSRAQVYVLNPLNSDDLKELIQRGLAVLTDLHVTDNAVSLLTELADGDGRRIFNFLEHLNEAAQQEQLTLVDESAAERILSRTMRRFDKQGDSFYDLVSALHKSVRGSNPDAALYWFTRMLDGGVDKQYLSRRIIRMAWEDIGLADPKAMQITNDAAATFERLGSPEGELALAQAVIYLAVAPKSNAGYMAFKKAQAFVNQDQSREVPLHLRNAPTKLMNDLGYSKGYRYAHDEPHGYAAGENYFPSNFPTVNWYQPVERGLEIKIKEKMRFLKELDKKARDD